MVDIPRAFSSRLDDWLARKDRRPLLIRGARQVGKSYAVRTWATRVFGAEGLLEINLEESPRLKQLFASELNAGHIVDQLNLLTGFNLRLPKRLLFIDEIQALPSAISALRFFYEQMPELPVIAAGSLLEFVIDTQGLPVGRVELLHLFPMSFREFLSAQGKEQLSEYIANAPLVEPVSQVVHKELFSMLRLYMRVGGMPKAVHAYHETRDIREVAREQELLLSTYREDFPKYAKRTQIETLHAIYSRIPYQIGAHRVKYTKVDPDTRIEKTKRAIELLQHAHIISKIYCSYATKLPLKAAERPEFFKLLFLDIGLLQHALGFNWQNIDPETDISTLCDGVFAEQFVGQELRAQRSSSTPYDLHYWDRNAPGSEAELDYLIEYEGEVAPLEVKSGLQGSLRSLHAFIKEYRPRNAFVLSQRNIERLDTITWLPLYLAGQLKP